MQPDLLIQVKLASRFCFKKRQIAVSVNAVATIKQDRGAS